MAKPPATNTQFAATVDPNPSAGVAPAFTAMSPAPSAPAGVQVAGVQAAGVSQVSDGLGDTTAWTSDSNAAGGPTNVIEQVNDAVGIYSRAGAPLAGTPHTSAQWYGVPASDSQYDPHTLYDPAGSRFITMMEDATKKAWMVSVTSTSDATSSRCTYTIGALNTGATSLDFPLMGLSDAYLILTIRESGGGNSNRLVIISLAQLEACQSAATWYWANVQHANGLAADTITPIMDFNIFDT